MHTPLSPQAQVPLRHSLRTTIFLQAAMLASIGVLLLLVTVFAVARAEIARTTFLDLYVQATRKADLLEHTLVEQRRHVARLAGTSDLRERADIADVLGLMSLFVLGADGHVMAIGIDGNPSIQVPAGIEAATTTAPAVLPRLGSHGLTSYWITHPLRGGTGTLVAVFDAHTLLTQLLDADSSIKIATTEVVYRSGDDILALHAMANDITPLYIAPYAESWKHGTPAANAVSGIEGVGYARDFAGVDVLSAYKSSPTLKVGIITSIDYAIALAPVYRLAAAIFGAGLAVVALTLLLFWSMSRRVSAPLLKLQRKLSALRTHDWAYERDVFTGNEVEIVDAAAFELTQRLRGSYDALEEKVQERTRQLSDAYATDEAIFASMEHGLLVTDRDGRITHGNAAALALLGESRLVGSMVHDVLRLTDRDGQELIGDKHPVARVLASPAVARSLTDPGHSLVRKDGSSVAVQVAVSPIVRDREPTGAVILLRDTTEERKVERMKSEFITIASHQLRTPISSIRWYTEMLLEAGSATDEQRRNLQEISIANERMIRLVDELLNVTNLELGTIAVRSNQVVDLASVMRDIEASFHLEIDQKHLSLTRDGHNDGLELCTDPVLFRLIYTNLLSNAVKYTPEGGSVRVSVAVSDADKRASISVTDTGIGIPASEHHRVFQKLFRAENVKTTDTDGTGLGLYICKSAADAIGATLTFDSAEGKGTTFTLVLPLKQTCD